MALKIIFMGTPEFSVPILKSLYESNHSILSVYTQPPKKKDRGQKINFTPIYEFSKKNNIELRYPEKLDTEEEISFIKKSNPDVIIVVAYGKIIPAKILDIHNIKFVNIHASLLPKWRGAAPIQRSIMNLDNETGISIMKIIPKLDAGPVMMTSRIKISKETNYKKLSQELSKLGAKLILQSLNLIENGKEKFIDQNENEVTYAKKIDKRESKINWKEHAEKVIAKINALYPKPGTWFIHNGMRLKILKAIEIEETGEPGQIIKPNFTVACAKNAVQLLEIQKEGKKIMKASEYLKGNKLLIGSNVN